MMVNLVIPSAVNAPDNTLKWQRTCSCETCDTARSRSTMIRWCNLPALPNYTTRSYSRKPFSSFSKCSSVLQIRITPLARLQSMWLTADGWRQQTTGLRWSPVPTTHHAPQYSWLVDTVAFWWSGYEYSSATQNNTRRVQVSWQLTALSCLLLEQDENRNRRGPKPKGSSMELTTISLLPIYQDIIGHGHESDLLIYLKERWYESIAVWQLVGQSSTKKK